MKKIGVLGGSFDPVHIGHLLLAEQAMEEAGLDKVYFMPAYIQPFKLKGAEVTNSNRLDMLNLSVKDNENICISTIELDSEEVSYTYKTLCRLKAKHGSKSSIWFILGSDAFLQIEQWHQSQKLLNEFSFMVGVRPGDDILFLENFSNRLKRLYNTNIHIIKNRQVDISSSEIRDRINAEKTIRYMVPLTVKYYIERNGLYSDKIKKIKQFIETNISSESRKKHIYSTATEAGKLAQCYGANIHKAYIAGLYHDIYKSLDTAEYEKIIDKTGISDSCLNNPELAHGKVAAAMIPQLFGESDKDVINAVSYHTTGRSNMSLLEKIIYIADLIERTRKYEGVDTLRSLAYCNIDIACKQGLLQTIELLKKNGVEIHEDSLSALKHFEDILKGGHNE